MELCHTSAARFSSLFVSGEPLNCHSNTNELVKLFNDMCTTALDNVAPLKCVSKLKLPSVSTWITERIRAMKRECRKVERLWKKSKLSVHHEHINFLLESYNSEIKDARAKYYSEIIISNQHNPRFL